MKEDYRKELQKFKERFGFVLKSTGTCVFEVELERRHYTFFENSDEIFGKTGEEILRDLGEMEKIQGTRRFDAITDSFFHFKDREYVERAEQEVKKGNAFSYQARMKHKNGSYAWCKIEVFPVEEEGIPVRMIGVITNINSLKRENLKLREKIYFDNFLRIYTKEYSLEMIEKTLETMSFQLHALIIMDMDNFKEVNDTYGHSEGDRVLLETAAQLKEKFRTTDIVGRFGGDEFIILMCSIPDTECVRKKLEGILHESRLKHGVTKSAGVAVFPEDGVSLDQLFVRADKALYAAKKVKNTYCFYSDIKE